MTGYMLDCSWARHGWPAVKAAGFTCVSLYLSNDPSKNCKPADVAALHAAGLQLLLNWESNPGRPLQGGPAGHADAVAANAQADALGYPDTCAIYYSCDTDAQPGQVAAYYSAAALASKRPVGAYGGAVVVRTLLEQHVTAFAWVANAGSWDHGVTDAGCHLHQHYHDHNVLPVPAGWGLNDYDESIVLQANFGQWGAAQTVKDFLMALDDATQLKLVANVERTADVVGWVLAFMKAGGYDSRSDGKPTHFDELAAAVASLKADVAALKASPVGPQPAAGMVQPIDYAALAKAVNDDAAKRMAS